MELIAVSVFLAATIAVLAIYGGVAFWILWSWFMVPLGLPEITLAWAIGIAAVFGMLTPSPPPAPPDKSFEHGVSILVKPLILLTIGFVAKSFM